MNQITDEQRAAIERIDAKLEPLSEQERLERMKAALSVTNEQVDEHIEANGGKGARKPKQTSGDHA